MFKTKVQPINDEVAEGLIGTEADFEETGTFRQGRPEYRTLRPFWFDNVTVPAGFVFDVHSLPILLRHRQPKDPSWWGPALIHDWCLESGVVSIAEANSLYLRAMRAIGVMPHHRFVAHAGVEVARHAFPDRITKVAPANWEMIEEVAGSRAIRREDGSKRRRKLAFMAVRKAASIYLATKGISLP